jgi:hypothetical protein
MTIQKPILQPGLPDLLNAVKNDIFASLNVCFPGEIQSFDGTKKTAVVRVMLKRILRDKIVSYPQLVDVPIFTLQGGGGAVYLPVQSGDPCLVLFADRCIDAWYTTGSEAAPTTQRCHDIADGIAFVGISSLVSPLADYPANEARMTYGGARLALKGGKANVQNATTSLRTALENLILGIQGGTYGTGSFVDTSTKLATALTELQALLFKD